MFMRALRLLAVLALLGTIPVELRAQVWEVGNRMLGMPVAQAEAWFGTTLAVGDFDGDGDVDLVVGAPGWNNGPELDAGRIDIFLSAPGRHLDLAYSDSPGGIGTERAGSALATGDFDDDGRAEIAIGRPGYDLGDGTKDVGAVSVLEYEPGEDWSYPILNLSQHVTPGTSPEASDVFGSDLAVGDFDGDGIDDLAVGAPGEGFGLQQWAGVVHVFHGSAGGLRTDNPDSVWADTPSYYENFGSALAAGDFDGDGYDDLAAAAGNESGSGLVEIHFGSATGVGIAAGQILTDQSFGNARDDEEEFGASLAAGNFDQQRWSCLLNPGTCFEDLAIGVKGEDLLLAPRAGKVIVAYGGATGLGTADETTIVPASVSEVAEVGDQLGFALAAGQLDRVSGLASYADLAIGAPYEDLEQVNEGSAVLVFGASGGINAGLQAQRLHEKDGLAGGPCAPNEGWGTALAIADFDGDGWGDLAIGVPDKNVDGQTDAGIVQILFGALFADGFGRGNESGW